MSEAVWAKQKEIPIKIDRLLGMAEVVAQHMMDNYLSREIMSELVRNYTTAHYGVVQLAKSGKRRMPWYTKFNITQRRKRNGHIVQHRNATTEIINAFLKAGIVKIKWGGYWKKDGYVAPRFYFNWGVIKSMYHSLKLDMSNKPAGSKVQTLEKYDMRRAAFKAQKAKDKIAADEKKSIEAKKAQADLDAKVKAMYDKKRTSAQFLVKAKLDQLRSAYNKGGNGIKRNMREIGCRFITNDMLRDMTNPEILNLI